MDWMENVLTVCLWTADLLKNKSRPETAAHEAAAWVESERALREKLKKEREARELKEKQEVSYPIQIDDHPSCPFWPVPGPPHLYPPRSLCSCLQREQRKLELLQKEKEAAELKKLEEAEAGRKAVEQAAALLSQNATVVVQAVVEQPVQVVEAGADKENSTADAPTEDDASTDSEDDRGDDQSASVSGTTWVSVVEDAST